MEPAWHDLHDREMHPTRWGDPTAAAPLPEAARALVELAFGIDERPAVETPEVAPSRLDGPALAELRAAVGAEHVLLDDDVRRLRTRGKSTPDLVRARLGDLADAPDAVVRPDGEREIAAVLEVAARHRLAVVPFGGGTSVTGGLVARREGHAGVISLDLVRMKRLLALDEVSMTATLEPGLRGPEAEALLAEHGLTLGHFPQSFEYASLGGFAATRSSGQSSAGYGRFDAMVQALVVVTPAGTLRLGRAPASAAGPDLRQLILGSEGALGVITELTVRVRRAPEAAAYDGWRFATFAAGRAALRAVVQAQLQPTVLRLSDEAETALNLARPDEVGAGDQGGEGGCLLICGVEGDRDSVARRRAEVVAALAEHGGLSLGDAPGESWRAGRFKGPYLRDAMLDVGVLVETLETATSWSNADRTYHAVRAALTERLPEPTLVLCHVSHVYETGCSLYFTVATRAGDRPVESWLAAKAAALDAIVACGATITHHHAIGTDHRAWLPAEIGDLGVRVLRAVKAELDPAGILNPGVLV